MYLFNILPVQCTPTFKSIMSLRLLVGRKVHLFGIRLSSIRYVVYRSLFNSESHVSSSFVISLSISLYRILQAAILQVNLHI